MKQRKTYLIGDPAVREKLNRRLRIAWKVTVYSFACIGLFALSFAVSYILHH